MGVGLYFEFYFEFGVGCVAFVFVDYCECGGWGFV